MASPPTATQVNTAVADGVDFIDFQQNANGSFGNGATGDVPETAAAIIAYGVLDKGDIANLPTALVDPAPPHATHNFRTDLTRAVTWLLGEQDITDPILSGQLGGSWTDPSGFYYTYSTGLALAALSFSSTVLEPAGAIATAIANGRSFLENTFQGPPNAVCTTAPADPTSSWCGGWNYDNGFSRSDESNSGFAMTGLSLTGGVPPAIKLLNVGWNNNLQADTTTNPTYGVTNNDGGGSYVPGCAAFGSCGNFTSNANDSGSMTFSYADDGLTTADPRVQVALQFDTDVMDTYEKAAHSGVTVRHTMVYHTHTSEDGSCDPSVGGCDWHFGNGEGGFHYSMFSLSKGLGAFIPPQLNDGTNWYAKMADLLVNQQATDATMATFGSWPKDGRDDFTTLFDTGLSIFALGLVGVPPPPTPTPTPSGIPVPSTGVGPGVGNSVTVGASVLGALAFAGLVLGLTARRRRDSPFP